MARTNETPRDLLFGLLALQIGLIDQDQLIGAFSAWTRARGKALAEILIDRGAIDEESRALLAGMAEKQLKLHGGDTEKSLAAVGVGPSTRQKLTALADTDLTASVALVGSHTPSPDATPTMSVGTATSDGQRFRVLRPHAQGGPGAVFVALDGELNREVALKQILDHHADDSISRTRFLIEAEITGGLEHPGIVPVYGLGHYGDGRPYYAMRFIRGDCLKEAIAAFHADESLTHDVGKRSLALRKLLRLFVDVCNAIDYAHGRGVLHRDLKPGNVIVGRYGETLVIDWGLAKPMGHSVAASQSEERTLIPSSSSGSAETLPGSAIGTPAYMSPEQAGGDLEKLGPRSDVYSLGATLYCLLTGKPPFKGEDLGEILRAVQRGDFPKPRQVDPSIDRALEAVCLKAMATHLKDRHATARVLADDIERWAADEPTSAWAEPFSVRARRWMRQNRTTVTAASVALVALLFGTASVLAVQTQANANLTKANNALSIANAETRAALDQTQKSQKETAAALTQSEESRKQAEAVGTFLVGTFRKSDPSIDSKDMKVADLLDQALAELDKGFVGAKATEGALLNALGQSYLGLGLYPKAEEAFSKARVVREAALGPDHPITLQSSSNLASAIRAAGRLAEAITLYESTLKQQEPKFGIDHPDTLGSRNNLAAAYIDAGRLAEGITLFELTLKQRESKLGQDDPKTLSTRNNLGHAYWSAGRNAEAIPIFEATLKQLESKLGPTHPDTLQSRNNLASAYRQAGRVAEAIPIFESTLKQQESKLGPDHPNTLGSRYNLASAYSSAGRWVDAEPLFRDTLDRRRKREKPNSPLLAGDLANLGRNLLKQSKWSEAEPLLRESLAIRVQAIPDDYRRFNTASQLDGALLGQGKYADAEPLVVAGYEGMKAREAKIPAIGKIYLTEAAERVIQLYRAWGKPDQAAAWAARLGLAELPADVFAR
jgi:eukaryotic-like serine/threonine-protein kinase